MQAFQHQMNNDDRRVARRWRLASLAFYGSIVGTFILYAAVSDREANYAGQPTAQAKLVASKR